MANFVRPLLILLIGLGTVAPAAAYLSPEHKRIGDDASRYGFRRYRRALRLPLKDRTGRILITRDGRIWTGRGAQGRYLTVGDLIALYGDFRKSVGELLSTPAKRLEYLAKVVREGTGKHKLLIFKELGTGFKLFENQSHFSSVAVRTYVDNHRRALALAAEAAKTGDASRLWLALHYEGLGYHSLTDIFAPGHTLIDRRKWVRDILSGKERVKGFLKNPLCGMAGLFNLARGAFGALLNKLAHDQFNKNGAELKNLKGQTWKAFGDHDYGKQSRKARMMPVRAVYASLREVMMTYLRLRGRARNPANFEKMRRILLRPSRSLGALLYIPVQFRNASYTPPLGRKKSLCAGGRFCDLLQRRAAEHYLGRNKQPVAMARAVSDCEDMMGRIRGFGAKVAAAVKGAAKKVASVVKGAAKKVVAFVKKTASKVKAAAKTIYAKAKVVAKKVYAKAKVAAKKACRWISRTASKIFAGAKMLACKGKCKFKNFFNRRGYNRCVQRSCKATVTRRSRVCR